MIKTENDLLDKYLVYGTDKAELKAELSNMDEVTHVKVRNGKEIILLSIAKIDKFSEPDKTTVYVLSDSYVSGFNERGEALHVANASDYKIGKELLKEATRTTGLLAVIDGELFVVGASALGGLSMQTGVAGETTLTRNGIIRDLHFADGLFINNGKTSIVYREVEEGKETIRKIYAFLGKRYIQIEQSTLIAILDKIDEESLLGKTDLQYYRMSHAFTDIYVDLPDAAKDIKDVYHLKDDIIPGLFLCTSDTGASAVVCRGTYRIGKNYVVMNEVAKKHTASNTVESFIESCDKEIFSEFRKLPETLAELMGKEILDYSKIDLTTEGGQEENKGKYAALVESLAKKLMPIQVVPGKVRTAICKAACDEMNPELRYSLYDVAILFMGLTDRTEGLLRAQIENMRKACAKAPYVLMDDKFVKSAKTEEKKAEEIVLLPE